MHAIGGMPGMSDMEGMRAGGRDEGGAQRGSIYMRTDLSLRLVTIVILRSVIFCHCGMASPVVLPCMSWGRMWSCPGLVYLPAVRSCT